MGRESWPCNTSQQDGTLGQGRRLIQIGKCLSKSRRQPGPRESEVVYMVVFDTAVFEGFLLPWAAYGCWEWYLFSLGLRIISEWMRPLRSKILCFCTSTVKHLALGIYAVHRNNFPGLDLGAIPLQISAGLDIYLQCNPEYLLADY